MATSEPLRLQLVTPVDRMFAGNVLAVTLPGELGEMQVYAGHVPLMTRLKPGVVRIHHLDGGTAGFQTEEGFARVTVEDVCILVDAATATVENTEKGTD